MSRVPRVTAIMIFFDEVRFIREAVESILVQNEREWELILVDDGSTDGSTEIAMGYAALDPERIRYVEHPRHANRGMSASRNLGLQHARGTYVGFLDADDVWLPEKLGEQLAAFAAHPTVQMVYGRTLLWHSWRGEPAADEFCDLGLPADTVVEPPRLLTSLIENRAQTPTTCNALMRRDAIVRVGAFEPDFRGMFEDQVLFMKLAIAAPVFVSSRVWARYRQREDSCSALAARTAEVPQARRKLLDWLERELRDRDVRSAEVWRALRRQRLATRWPALHAVYGRCKRLMQALGSSHANR